MTLQSPIAIALSIAHGVQRLGHGGPWAGLRSAATQLASLLLVSTMRRPEPGTQSGTRPRGTGLLARAIVAIEDVYTLARHGEAQVPVPEAPLEAELIEARHQAEQWRIQAEASERRAAELEARLAASEMTALDLRSRLVCLHGKLATTTATVRYQSMAQALESQLMTPPGGTAASMLLEARRI